MRNTTIWIGLTGFTVLSAFSLLSAQDLGNWPCWRGPNHDGKSTETGLLKAWPQGGPTQLWNVNGLGKGFSTVSIADGVIYASGDVGNDLILFALDGQGQKMWHTRVDKAWSQSTPGSRSTPTIDEGLVYLLSGNGVLGCFKTEDGKEIWSKDLSDLGGKPGGWGYAESVLVLGDLAIAKPGGSNCIVAFDKKDGSVRWKSTRFNAGPEYGSCIPVGSGGSQMIVTGTNRGIIGVNAVTGRTMWSNEFCANNTANCPDPAYADGYVFWANGYGKGGICLKLESNGTGIEAKEVYRTNEMVCHHGGYVIRDGYIYGNHNNGFSCLDLRTGKVRWNVRGPGKGSLVYADGMLYLFGESNGRAALATCNPQSCDITGELRVDGSGPSWAHPVVAGGRLYLRYDDNLYCFDVRKP
ncbi:MAG: PQQ-binding-like beta-propeller repeat protein [Sedimentisphaerales bacterium]|nr:PQQ-binding-like beta-propeller repeat protein [Sedimentisphaerales bacterium]